MESFLGSIQGYFRQQYGGRYLGLVLQEMIQRDPSIGAILLGGTKQNVTSEREVSYIAKGGNKRFADLVLYAQRGTASETAVAVEIKFDDQMAPRNHMQLRDYAIAVQAATKVNGRPLSKLVVLTKSPLDVEESRLISKLGITKAEIVTFTQFGEKLAKLRTPLSALLVSFFHDKGLIVTEVNPELLKALMVLLFLPHRSKHGRLQKGDSVTSGVPDTLKSLMSNLQIVANDVLAKYRNGNRRMTVSFSPIQHFAAGGTDQEGDWPIYNKNRGILNVFAHVPLGPRQKRYLQIGYDLRIRHGSERQGVEVRLYASHNAVPWRGDANRSEPTKLWSIVKLGNRELQIKAFNSLCAQLEE